MRQIVLDTETTGLDPAEGHRIIEIGCIELINRRRTDNYYHQYINPEREIDEGAMQVHGITNAILADKPRFADIAGDFLAFVSGAALIIHNAPFDVGFINQELTLMNRDGAPDRIESLCEIVDTLQLARRKHPGQKNDLDSLCKRYNVDNTQRTLHGARLDAEILVDVYLAMTGGQTGLFEESRGHAHTADASATIRRIDPNRTALTVLRPTPEELAAHEAWLEEIEQQSSAGCLWKRLGG